ncbi:hypothetical protein BALCAV_0208480 [Alkalihalobacillus alcalophilus ATCC 27647 = CGMCC 1.3604]|uniref:Zinc finger DksA/TraR C4-type domain-containing protein n=1 Tax=Alkalihalobacillus alcalophilus ATCC 27647 = CGMCC 1.3604 TaxID=1218173 RepID=A0A094WP64_ALKAL|nr:hypothetical protein BALCAV_0208480 [Alkalihalobacillus alcalophilus ATCC 27647 = CGMCC 1.3604]
MFILNSNFKQLHQQLLQQKEEFEQQLKHFKESELHNSESASTGELSQYDNHPADTATELYEREKDFALEEHAAERYHQVLDALERIKNGTYGICEKTGQEIPFERLQANPTAKIVVSATESHVQNYRPIEEEAHGRYERYNFDHNSKETEFDAEDAYQAVARFNDNSMTYEDASLDDDDESVGYVEEIEGFLSTGIDGYRGAENVQFQRNVHMDHYFDEYEN